MFQSSVSVQLVVKKFFSSSSPLSHRPPITDYRLPITGHPMSYIVGKIVFFKIIFEQFPISFNECASEAREIFGL